MCMCEKPNKNGEPGYCWNDATKVGTYPVNAPALADGDALVFDEPGRCKPQVNGKGGTDYHSHHFRLVMTKFDQFYLLVRHGGGTERIPLGYDYTRLGELIRLLPDSDARYLMLQALYRTHEDAERGAEMRTAAKFRQAFVEGRLKKRKVRGRNAYDVRIEPKLTSGAA